MSDETEGTIGDLVEAQIEEQGVSCIRIDGGHVFTFTREILRQMLQRAELIGKVVVVVHTGAAA